MFFDNCHAKPCYRSTFYSFLVCKNLTEKRLLDIGANTLDRLVNGSYNASYTSYCSYNTRSICW